MSKKGDGKTIQWIRGHTSYPHDEWCLIWPFSTTRGYGRFSYLGKAYYSHHFMCALVHGEAPSETHEAAHSCGNAGCVNPHHVSWKTPTENGLDCREHGTSVRHRYGSIGKITSAQAETIRNSQGVKTLLQLANEYSVSESTISNIWTGKTHSRPSKIIYWTTGEERQLKDGIAAGMNFTQIAKIVGKKAITVSAKAYRIGLSSGQPVRKTYDPPKVGSPSEGGK